MPSLLLGWPNKREREKRNLHTFADNTQYNGVMLCLLVLSLKESLKGSQFTNPG